MIGVTFQLIGYGTTIDGFKYHPPGQSAKSNMWWEQYDTICDANVAAS